MWSKRQGDVQREGYRRKEHLAFVEIVKRRLSMATVTRPLTGPVSFGFRWSKDERRRKGAYRSAPSALPCPLRNYDCNLPPGYIKGGRASCGRDGKTLDHCYPLPCHIHHLLPVVC